MTANSDTTSSDTSSTDNPSTDNPGTDIGYVDALAELEEILEELEDDNVDIDVLSVRVERAAELIAICRGRIHRAQEQVASIVADFDSAEPDSDSGD